MDYRVCDLCKITIKDNRGWGYRILYECIPGNLSFGTFWHEKKEIIQLCKNCKDRVLSILSPEKS